MQKMLNRARKNYAQSSLSWLIIEHKDFFWQGYIDR